MALFDFAFGRSDDTDDTDDTEMAGIEVCRLNLACLDPRRQYPLLSERLRAMIMMQACVPFHVPFHTVSKLQFPYALQVLKPQLSLQALP